MFASTYIYAGVRERNKCGKAIMFESQIVALNDFDLRRVYYPAIRMDVSQTPPC